MNNKESQLTSVQPLLDYFNQLIPLNDEEKGLISAKFHSHLFLKKQFALSMEVFVSILILWCAVVSGIILISK